MFRPLVLFTLLSATTFAEPLFLRHLEDADEQDISWLVDYNVVYVQCSSTAQSVLYKICPRSDNADGRNSCSVDCENGADYMANLADFIDSFTEAQMEARAYRCEMARENCQYDDDISCYDSSSGYDLSYCQNDWDEALDIQEWLECKEMEGGEDEYGNKYYVGPYCASDNYNLYLGVFTDEDCTVKADDDSAYSNANEGTVLPYSAETGESLVGSNSGNNHEDNEHCASCKEHALEQDKNEGDQEDEDDVLEQCEDLYAYTYAKCETNLDIDNADESDCETISIIRDADIVTAGGIRYTDGNAASRIGGWFVFLFIALVIGALVSQYMRHRSRQQNKLAHEQQAVKGDVEEKGGPSNEKLLD
uniref:Uncharacterized protein n=1 Tax=Amphora coffeiformis TaxID=265554 RepID=A0A7S3L4F3_9STRA|mmetsp:Transcript_18683/g.35506  ORF Transcript_18683/g.35506 Transcript_18683/m.35506 type:complete len:363 (+) Transcript_18683:108-1196(+)|eukprot:scaffold1982_cov93-Amphora_coffeaeformis.AAC.7